MAWRWLLMLAACGCGRIGFALDTLAETDARADASSLDAPAALDLVALAYWPFDDAAGTTAVDATGHGHTLALVNGPTWTTGVSNGAVQADGVDDYLTTPSLDLSGTMAVTVSFWTLRTYATGPLHTLVELSSDFNSQSDAFGIFPDDVSACSGQIMIGVNGDVGYDVSCYDQPSSGVWHHLVAVYDKARPGGQETQLYIDGVIAPAITRPNTADNTNSFGNEPLFVFSRGGTLEYNAGSMDELAIFARALTPIEIARL